MTEEQVRQALPMAQAIRAVREAFAAFGRGEAWTQPRRRLVLPTGTILHSMAGAIGPYLATKVYTTQPRHGAHFTVLLYQADTGEPLAQMEANALGQIRTGAATGVATDLLARPDAHTLAVIGTGFQAETQVEAILAVRPIRQVGVWSRHPERREHFAARCQERWSVQALALDSAESAVAEAQVIVTATSAATPVFAAEAVPSGCHVNAVGSNWPQRRELPGELVKAAAPLVVDDLESARLEAGDLLLALGPDEWDQRVRPLSALLQLPEAVQWQSGRLSVFKSVGIGLEDAAVAGHIYEQFTSQAQNSATPE